MYSKENKIIEPETIDIYLKDFVFKNRDLIAAWSAGLLDRLEHPDNRRYKRLSGESEKYKMTDGNFSYIIKFSDNLPISMIRTLNILQWYLPEEPKFLIRICTEQSYNKLQLYDHVDITIFRESKNYVLLYLSRVSQMRIEAFFGQLHQVIRYLKTEVDNNLSSKPHKYTIFPTLFWISSGSTKVEKYTGYRRHQNDHGSLRSENYHITNILEDEEYQKEIQELYDSRIKFTHDVIDLTLGFML